MVRSLSSYLGALSLFSILILVLPALPAAARTTLYLSPSDSSLVSPISINAAQANQVLSHHLNIPSTLSLISDTSAPFWAHLARSNPNDPSHVGRSRVEHLFDGVDNHKNRLLVLVHGLSDSADLVPNHIHATHTILSSPSLHSFDALLHSYMNELRQSLRLADSTFFHLGLDFINGFQTMASGVEDALERATSWFMGLNTQLHSTSTSRSDWWENTMHLAGSTKSAAIQVVQSELTAVHQLLERIHSGEVIQNEADALAFQPLRFQGLADVRAEYGVESAEFAQVKQLLRSALAELTFAFENVSSEQHRTASIALVFNEDKDTDLTSANALSKRSNSAQLLAPFGIGTGAHALKPLSSPRGPVCYQSWSELERATRGCSGHGKGIQSSKGGHKCWRCACEPSRKDGHVTYWAGSACEKKDVSSEFILLGGTTLVLLLVVTGSVYLLLSAGSAELPGVLSGATIKA